MRRHSVAAGGIRGRLVAVGALAACLAVGPLPASATAGTLSGTAVASANDCPSNSDRYLISGINSLDDSWTFTVVGTRVAWGGSINESCAGGSAGVIQGHWNPATGGWINDAGVGSIYIGPVPSRFALTPTVVSICLFGTGCVNGSANLIRT